MLRYLQAFTLVQAKQLKEKFHVRLSLLTWQLHATGDAVRTNMHVYTREYVVCLKEI